MLKYFNSFNIEVSKKEMELINAFRFYKNRWEDGYEEAGFKVWQMLKRRLSDEYYNNGLYYSGQMWLLHCWIKFYNNKGYWTLKHNEALLICNKGTVLEFNLDMNKVINEINIDAIKCDDITSGNELYYKYRVFDYCKNCAHVFDLYKLYDVLRDEYTNFIIKED